MTKDLPLSQLLEHPDNPRYIREANYRSLVNSVKKFPEMLKARPLVVNQDMTVIGGNMRLRALRELQVETAPVLIVDWTEEQQHEFMVKDNLQLGEFDWDMMANQWDQNALIEWGIPKYHFGLSQDQKLEPIDPGELHRDPKGKSATPSLADGYVEVTFVMEVDQKNEIMDTIRAKANDLGSPMGAALYELLKND